MSNPGGGGSSVENEKVPVGPAYVERRENSPRYVFGGGVWIVLTNEAQTSGNITNVESIYQRGGGLPRLLDEREDEMAYVVSGACEFASGTTRKPRPNPVRWSSSRAA